MNTQEETLPRLEKTWVPTGDELRIIRKSFGLDMEEVADGIGLSERTILNWENENSSPSAKHLRELLAFYRMEAERQREEK